MLGEFQTDIQTPFAEAGLWQLQRAAHKGLELIQWLHIEFTILSRSYGCQLALCNQWTST